MAIPITTRIDPEKTSSIISVTVLRHPQQPAESPGDTEDGEPLQRHELEQGEYGPLLRGHRCDLRFLSCRRTSRPPTRTATTTRFLGREIEPENSNLNGFFSGSTSSHSL